MLPLLTVYSGLLLFAALPDEIRPDAVADAQRTVRQGFEQANIRPFAFVFAGRRGRWKRRSVALTAYGRLPDGRLERVFAAPDGPLPGYRLHQPAEETVALKALVLSPANKLMGSTGRGQRAKQIRRLRRNARIRGLGRFACHSSYAADGRAERAYLSVAYDAIDYRTGKLFDAAHVIQVYDCRRDRPVYGGRWPEAERGAGGLPRPLLGVAEPVLEPSRSRKRRRKARARRKPGSRRSMIPARQKPLFGPWNSKPMQPKGIRHRLEVPTPAAARLKVRPEALRPRAVKPGAEPRR